MAWRGRGFTLLELIIVMGLLVALAGVVLLVASRTRSTATSLNCLGNLKQVTGALRSYAFDHGSRFPDPGAAELPWEKMIAKYLPNTSMLICPADSEIAPVTGSSYDWRDTTLPEATLAGKLFSDVRRSDAVLTIESLPGWHAQGQINVGLVDGSSTTMDANKAMSDLMKPIR
jgi:prepilin-type N-terminal cleavage/methylation domain-containing protein